MHELRVTRANSGQLTGVRILRKIEQPGRQPAPIPLGANVGPGPENDEQSMLLCDVEESEEVFVAIEVELAGCGLVQVPRHVDVDRVESHRARLR